MIPKAGLRLDRNPADRVRCCRQASETGICSIGGGERRSLLRVQWKVDDILLRCAQNGRAVGLR